MEYRITCIQKAVTEDSVTVTDVGGIDALGERWTMSVEEAAELLSSGEGVFLFETEQLKVIEPESKRLLQLPSCP